LQLGTVVDETSHKVPENPKAHWQKYPPIVFIQAALLKHGLGVQYPVITEHLKCILKKKKFMKLYYKFLIITVGPENPNGQLQV
jgi:hypothetical protein